MANAYDILIDENYKTSSAPPGYDVKRHGETPENCCYLQAFRCDDDTAADLWVRRRHVDPAKAYKIGGTCYYFDEPASPCPGTTRHVAGRVRRLRDVRSGRPARPPARCPCDAPTQTTSCPSLRCWSRAGRVGATDAAHMRKASRRRCDRHDHDHTADHDGRLFTSDDLGGAWQWGGKEVQAIAVTLVNPGGGDPCYWELTVTVYNSGDPSVLMWVGHKFVGATHAGVYTRTGGAAATPATLTVT